MSHLSLVIVTKYVVPEAPKVLLLALLLDRLDLLWRQLERRAPQIIRQPLFLGARRDRDDVLIDTPTQRNLALADSVPREKNK